MNLQKRIIRHTFLLLLLLTVSCSRYPDAVKLSLDMAGDNCIQLEDVISHFKNDKEKLQAAYFLIGNMADKGTYKIDLVDVNGASVNFNISNFKTEAEENIWLDSIKVVKGELHIIEGFLPDLEHISAKFLIKNIDMAFEAKAKSPFCKGISNADFYEYILPYRISNEKLESWREVVLKEFKKAQIDSIYSFSTSLAAANYIDDIYQKFFVFGGRRFFKQRKIRCYSELMKDKIGKCSDMCNIVIMALRTFGIPSGFDSMRYKRASNDVGHQWCFVLDTKTNKTYPFDALSNNGPGWFNLPYKNVPKVVRRQYASVDKHSILNNENIIHPDFYRENALKVTSEYFETTNISIPLSEIHKEPVYLNIYHSGRWKPIDCLFSSDSLFAKFEDVTKNNMYCLSSYRFFENNTIGAPFVVNRYGEIKDITSFGVKTKIALNTYAHKQIKGARNNTKIFDFVTKNKISEKHVDEKQDKDHWINVSVDSLSTNTFYVFSNSSIEKGNVFIFKNDGSMDWF